MCARRWACRWNSRPRSKNEGRSKTRFKRSVGGDSCFRTGRGSGCGSAHAQKKKEESGFSFSVSLGGLYQGPLDLLLDLIRKQDIDIYDIPIAKITAQYLAYVEEIRDMDGN